MNIVESEETKISADGREITTEMLRRCHGKRYMEECLAYYRQKFTAFAWEAGYSPYFHDWLHNYSPDGLSIMDGNVGESAEEIYAKEDIRSTPSLLWSFYRLYGTYFGDVIVRNLGGEWEIPSSIRLTLSRLLWWPELLFFHWNVKLNGKRIPVFKIAKWRFDGSGRVPSLAEAYDRIKSTGMWP
jgi:hypothetical protein